MFLHLKNILSQKAIVNAWVCLGLSGVEVSAALQTGGSERQSNEREMMLSQSGPRDQAPTAGMLPVSWEAAQISGRMCSISVQTLDVSFGFLDFGWPQPTSLACMGA